MQILIDMIQTLPIDMARRVLSVQDVYMLQELAYEFGVSNHGSKDEIIERILRAAPEYTYEP